MDRPPHGSPPKQQVASFLAADVGNIISSDHPQAQLGRETRSRVNGVEAPRADLRIEQTDETLPTHPWLSLLRLAPHRNPLPLLTFEMPQSATKLSIVGEPQIATLTYLVQVQHYSPSSTLVPNPCCVFILPLSTSGFVSCPKVHNSVRS